MHLIRHKYSDANIENEKNNIYSGPTNTVFANILFFLLIFYILIIPIHFFFRNFRKNTKFHKYRNQKIKK